jgi:hypothetical protein
VKPKVGGAVGPGAVGPGAVEAGGVAPRAVGPERVQAVEAVLLGEAP